MWITQQAWTRWLEERKHEREAQKQERLLLVDEWARERALFVNELVTLRVQNVALQATIARSERDVDWLRVRCNQLEQERSALMLKINGIFIPTPTIAREESSLLEQNALGAMDLVGRDADD